MGAALISNLFYYLPSLLAHLVALGVAVVLFPRARTAALLLAGGTALQLLASACSYGSTAWMMTAYEGGDMAASDVGMITGVLGFLASVLRAVGEVGVVAAVGFAVMRPEATPDK